MKSNQPKSDQSGNQDTRKGGESDSEGKASAKDNKANDQKNQGSLTTDKSDSKGNGESRQDSSTEGSSKSSSSGGWFGWLSSGSKKDESGEKQNRGGSVSEKDGTKLNLASNASKVDKASGTAGGLPESASGSNSQEGKNRKADDGNAQEAQNKEAMASKDSKQNNDASKKTEGGERPPSDQATASNVKDPDTRTNTAKKSDDGDQWGGDHKQEKSAGLSSKSQDDKNSDPSQGQREQGQRESSSKSDSTGQYGGKPSQDSREEAGRSSKSSNSDETNSFKSSAGRGGSSRGSQRDESDEDGTVIRKKINGGWFSLAAIAGNGTGMIVGISGVAVIILAVGAFVVRRRLNGSSKHPGGSQGSYYSIEMGEGDVEAGQGVLNDEFKSFAKVSNTVAEVPGKQGNDGWGDEDGWDEDFDNFDSKTTYPTLTALDKNGIKVLFDFEKSDPDSFTTIIMATFRNSLPNDMTEFSCKVAVPKHLQITMGPPSSTILRGNGGAITQTMNVTNGQRGSKPLKMRLVIQYVQNGEKFRESADVSNFPSGL
uniref:GAE domain-containing protein n=1 Tax=Hanusia phi TaxID=3032 RepID=A0A7S0EN88_9CRYP